MGQQLRRQTIAMMEGCGGEQLLQQAEEPGASYDGRQIDATLGSVRSRTGSKKQGFAQRLYAFPCSRSPG